MHQYDDDGRMILEAQPDNSAQATWNSSPLLSLEFDTNREILVNSMS